MAEVSYGIGLSNTRSTEQRRLAALEHLFDAGTFRHLDNLGVTGGMHCLELGGGAGSIARWMAERVGRLGSVVVTDLDVSRLAGCDRSNIEVRVHDVCTDSLAEGVFDVIHARLLLEHLPTRLAVLDKLVTALRPGGGLLVEDFDMSAILYLPAERLLFEPKEVLVTLQATTRASAELGAAGSWDGEFGRDLPVHLVTAGLECVGSEACTPLMLGGSPGAEFLTLSLREFEGVLVPASVNQSDYDRLVEAFEQPGAMCGLYTMVSSWGRRPH